MRIHFVPAVGEPFMAPAAQYVFAEMRRKSEHFTAGRHECLPYSKNVECSEIYKHQFRLSAFISRSRNWCLKYCSAKRLGFPRGEAVMRSMTDEDRRNLFSSHAVRKKAACLDFFHTICVHMATKLSPFLIRPYGAPSPRGKVFRKPLDFQTLIYRSGG